MFKKIISVILLSAGVFLLSGCEDVSDNGTRDYNAGKTYRIGVITSLTGPTAAIGQQQKNILDYQVNKLNKKNSFKTELLYEDGQCDAVAAGEAMRKLIEGQKVQFVIGGLCSPATFGAASVAKDKKVVLLSAITSNKNLENISPTVLSLSYSDDLLPEAMIQELKKYEKVATLSEKVDDSAALEKDLDDLLFSKYKDEVTLAADEKFERESTDFTDQIKTIRNSGADVLLLNPSSKISALALLKALEKEGMKIKLIGQFAYNNPEIVAEAPSVINNMVVIDYPTVKGAEFIQNRKDIISEKGPLDDINNYYAAATIDSLDLLVKLISENGGDFDSVQKALTTGSFTGNIGKIYFGGNTFMQNQKAQRLEIKDRQLIDA